MSEVLIATLATEAQVVTLSLLALEKLGYQVSEVVIVHTSGATATIHKAMLRLDTAFSQDERLKHYIYRRELLAGQRTPIADITTAAEAQETFEALFQIIRHYKLTGHRVHLNVAGGRKPMSIYGMVVAQMLFDKADCLWHLVSNEPLVKSRRLFPLEEDDYQLVPIPVIQATDRPDLIQETESAKQAIEAQVQLRHDQKIELFLMKLTKTQRKVVALMAQGLSNGEMVAELGSKMNTVTKHVSKVYDCWRSEFNLEGNSDVRGLIISEMKGYFVRRMD